MLNLKAQGVPADDISLILMAENGLDLYGNAIMVNTDFAAKNPEAVKGFLQALIKGVRDTVKDPASAVDGVLKRNDVVKKDVELERLKMALAQNFVTPAVKKNGFGGIEAADEASIKSRRSASRRAAPTHVRRTPADSRRAASVRRRRVPAAGRPSASV